MKAISLKREFEAENRATAEFIAFLTNAVVYFDDEDSKYHLTTQDHLIELVRQRREQQDYLGANQILQTAKRTFGREVQRELIQITAVTLACSAGEYLQLVKQAYQQDKSISDVIKAPLVRQLEGILADLQQSREVDAEKLNHLRAALEAWKERETQRGEHYRKQYRENHQLPRDVFQALEHRLKQRIKQSLAADPAVPEELIESYVEAISLDEEEVGEWPTKIPQVTPRHKGMNKGTG